MDQDSGILDFSKAQMPDNIERSRVIDSSHLETIFRKFVQEEGDSDLLLEDPAVYCHKALPGKEASLRSFLIVPSLRSYRTLILLDFLLCQ